VILKRHGSGHGLILAMVFNSVVKVALLVSSKIMFLWPKKWRNSIRMHKLYWSILVLGQHLALWQCTMYCYTQLQQVFFLTNGF